MSRLLDFNGRLVDLAEVLDTATVSDHALVRWLERVDGVPIDALKRVMLSEAVLHGMAVGAKRVRLEARGLDLVLEGRTVVTVVKLGGGRR